MTNETTYNIEKAKTVSQFDNVKHDVRKELTQKNMFYIEHIYIGDADEGEEGICGHQRHYKVGNIFVITEDDNPEQFENIVAILIEEGYKKEYGN